MSLIDTLIDKQDNFEIVRDQITAILATEVASQVAKATAAGKTDPENWNLQIFSERFRPWEQFLNDPKADEVPIVNVWYGGSTFDEAKSDVVKHQASVSIFNIDCYGMGISKVDGSGGHIPADVMAATQVQRALVLVRNILMAGTYTYLGLRGLVWNRFPESVTVFQPEQEASNVQAIEAIRIALRVTFNEFSPQVTPVDLEFVAVDVIRTEDGQVVAEADYDYVP